MSAHDDLVTALQLLYEECVLAGHTDTDGYGWPKALSAARTILGITASHEELEMMLVQRNVNRAAAALRKAGAA